MRKMLDIADSIEKVPQFFGRLGSWLIIPLIAIIMFDVLTRKMFGGAIQQWIQENPALYDFLSPTKLQEWEWHLHGALFMLAIGFSYTMNAHVRVDVLREKASDRKQAWIELTGLIAFQNMSSKFNNALGVPAQGFCPLPASDTGQEADGR